MARLARVVCPEIPHHITQRGVRRFNVFLDDADHRLYIELLRHYCPRFELAITGYCLMTNHLHLVGIPHGKDSIAKVLKSCNGEYATEFNKKYRKSGHVWQGRSFSCVLDESHAVAALRYVERNPVRAGMVGRAEDYRWSSARAHCGIADDPLLSRSAEMPHIVDWSEWLAGTIDKEQELRIRARTYSGRPCGDDAFVRKIENLVGRPLMPKKSGPKHRNSAVAEQGTLWGREEADGEK